MRCCMRMRFGTRAVRSAICARASRSTWQMGCCGLSSVPPPRRGCFCAGRKHERKLVVPCAPAWWSNNDCCRVPSSAGAHAGRCDVPAAPPPEPLCYIFRDTAADLATYEYYTCIFPVSRGSYRTHDVERCLVCLRPRDPTPASASYRTNEHTPIRTNSARTTNRLSRCPS